MKNSYSQSLRFWQFSVLMAAVCGINFGCNGADESSAAKNNKNSTEKSTSKSNADLLNKALDMLQPDRLRVSSDTATAVGLINQWSTTSATDEINQDISEATRRLLTDDILKRIKKPLFAARDAQHLRNCFYFKKAAQFASGFSESDVDQMVDVFHYVIRNVDLIAETGDSIPISPFGIGLFGRGTARERAWLFANLLRQLRIDAVIIESKGENTAAASREFTDKWCVAAILNGNAYLFDTRLGIPIPADNEDINSPLIRRPATLSQAIQNDAILRNLDLPDRPYPLSADSLKQIRISVIGNSCFWAPRMQRIQSQLSGVLSVVAFDGFEDTDFGKGLLSRMNDFKDGLSTSAELAIWRFPEERLDSYANLDEGQKSRLRVRSQPLDASRPIVSAKQFVILKDGKGGIANWVITGDDGTTLMLEFAGRKMPVPADEISRDRIKLKLSFGPPRRQLFQTRIEQILCDYSKATTKYVPIRLWNRLPPAGEGVKIPEKDKAYYEAHLPSEIRTMHKKAAENALFWMATCQFEKRDFQAASETLKLYLSRHENGKWSSATRFLLAMTYLVSDRLTDAIEVLEQTETTDPQRDGFELLIRRWKTISKRTAAEK